MTDDIERVAEEVCPIRKLHFLLSPGTYLNPQSLEDSGELSADETERFVGILRKYLEKARGMAQDELMILYMLENADDFCRDLHNGQTYATYIQILREILGDRLIVFTMDSCDFDAPGAFGQAVQVIVKARHFTIRPDAESEAYGEIFAGELENRISMFHDELGLRTKTKILLACTDADFDHTLDEIRAYVADVMADFDNLEYVWD